MLDFWREIAMTILLWIIGLLVAFNFIYKFFNRKNFKVIKYLEKTMGCSTAVAHKFVAFGMPDAVGFSGWAKMRDYLIKDPANYEFVILPLFVDWYLKQAANESIYQADRKIIEEALSNLNLTFSDIERRLLNAETILITYKLKN